MAATSRANSPVMKKPGEDEKDVHAHVAAGEPRNARVEEHDEENR